MESGYDIDDLLQQAQSRWLHPRELVFIIRNHDSKMISRRVPHKPASGSVNLYDRSSLPSFRSDGHNWRKKKKKKKSVDESHETLKVDNVAALKCYYAKGEDNQNFRRRIYWVLDGENKNIVLVHYRDTTEGTTNSTSTLELSPGQSYTLTQSVYNVSPANQSTDSLSDLPVPFQSLCSPHSLEVNSGLFAEPQWTYHFDNSTAAGNVGTPAEVDMSDQELQRLLEQFLESDGSVKELDQVVTLKKGSADVISSGLPGQSYTLTQSVNNVSPANQSTDSLSDLPVPFQSLCSPHSLEVNSGLFAELQWTYHFDNSTAAGNVGTPAEVDTSDQELQRLLEQFLESDGSVKELDQVVTLKKGSADVISSGLPDDLTWEKTASLSASQEAEKIEITPCGTKILEMLSDPGQFQMPQVGPCSSRTIIPEHRFEIREISPKWCFADEVTKVIVIGSFHCDPSELAWAKFGDIEVPIQIMQDGVICCQTPLNCSGKVTFCINSINRESCSEVKDFEFRDRNNGCNKCIRQQQEEYRSMEEVLLLVKFVQMLLFDSSLQNRDSNDFHINPFRIQKGYDCSRDYITDALLTGCGISSSPIDWALQELLKDKLQQWLSIRFLDGGGNLSCILSKQEREIIHIAAGLGYDWALEDILTSGVGINFRDTNGWTALHWAARFGREKMVAALIAAGASVGVVTDPTTQYPMGKDPASIADAYGHKGLAGYLSELALNSFSSALTFEEAKVDVSNSSTEFVGSAEDQTPMEKVLAASRNATQTAALIDASFGVESFRRMQKREAANRSNVDEYGLTSEEIQGLSAAVLPYSRNHNVAALTIQKYYRGRKRRTHYLTLRRKVVKIQAHIRGYQVRKYYRIVWAVGITEKIVLRWLRKGRGLRGYKPKRESIDGSEEDEDILKVFRRQKVHTTIHKAVKRICFMIYCRQAQDQYTRMLETDHQAKQRYIAKLGGLINEGRLTSVIDAISMDIDEADAFQLPLEYHADTPDYSELWSHQE